jgi:hypothetical protein
MNTIRYRQRGEGKVGCTVTLLVFIILVAAGIKIVPVLWNDNQLKDYADDACLRAMNGPAEALQKDIQKKARELDIQEALAAGAIKVTKTGDREGICTVHLKYGRTVDLYGIFSFRKDVDQTLSHQFATF